MSDAQSAPLFDAEAMQVRYLYRNAHTGLVVNAAVGLLIGWAMWERVDRSDLLLWVSAILGASALRLLQLRAFERHFDAADAARWANRFLLGAVATAALWGLAPWWFEPRMTLESAMFLAFAQGGLTAGAAAVLGVIQRVYVSYALVIMVPLIAWFVARGSAYGGQMAAMLVVYLGAMLSAGLIYRRVVVNNIVVSRQLAEARDRAERASRAKSEFLSRMSHELRTPLNAILGFAQLMALDRERTLSEEQRARIGRINDSGVHLLGLIDEVLELARIEQGQLELQATALGLETVLADVVERLQPVARQHGLRIDTRCEAGLTAWADAERVCQILLNLVGNAIRYGGTDGRVEVAAAMHGERVRIAVHDDGPGIAADRHEAVFEPFNRLEEDAAASDGAGIGLTISRSLARGMGGDVTLESSAGRGATFLLDLPPARS